MKMAAPMSCIAFCFVVLFHFALTSAGHSLLPVVINTWPFTNATKAAWHALYEMKSSSLDAVVAGCSECEVQQCDGTVGYGGDPDESGETTLDAMVMDGKTMDVGAVGSIRSIKNAIGVAKAVLQHTEHTLLVGELATQFAVEMGFKQESLSTNRSQSLWKEWKSKKCQPNFWKGVTPDPKSNCGPYHPSEKHMGQKTQKLHNKHNIGIGNHDTIGMVAIDASGNIASGTTTNGLNHKIPGRVGDSPIMGAGSYAVNGMGGAASTGNGDIMMRFLPSYHAVMMMGQGMDPSEAAAKVLHPIMKFYPSFTGAVITINKDGVYGAACYGFAVFQYSVVNPGKAVHVEYKDCIRMR